MTAELARQAAAIDAAATALIGALDPGACEDVAHVSPTQLRVLGLLHSTVVNVNGLAEALGVGPSSASRLCDRLEALGFVERVTDPRDRREVRLQLTTAAKELLDKLTAHRHAVLPDSRRMPDVARAELVRSLAEFAAAGARGTAAVRKSA